MKILIDGRRSIGGVERYTRGLIALLRSGSNEDEVIVFGERARVRGEAGDTRGALRAMLGDFKRVAGDQLGIPWRARRSRVDIFHSINYFVPRQLGRPSVVTYYDLWLLEHGDEKKGGWVTRYERRQLMNALRRADRCIAISETVARRMRAQAGCDEERVHVIYPPLAHLNGWSDVSPTAPCDGRPFFLFVGTLEPRKNLERVLEAHRTAYAECGIPLYVAGPYGWKQESVVRRIAESGDAARRLGEVDDGALASLYRSAVAVIAFSRDEGFDYPAVEAMHFGAPLVLSDIPVHREVIGEIGLYAPPEDAEMLARRLLAAAAMTDDDRAQYRRNAGARVARLRALGDAERYGEVYRLAMS